MEPQSVNIICIDVPYPQNYGGAQGSFDLIRRFNEAGFKVYLHLFHYKNEQDPQGLRDYAQAIFVYPRKRFLSCIASGKAYIIASRDSQELRNNLRKLPYPIFCEGIHNSSVFDDPDLAKRSFVRWHNVDSVYYRGLMKSENSFVKKAYFWLESMMIQKQEQFLLKNYFDRNYFLSSLDMNTVGVQDMNKLIVSALRPSFAIVGLGNYNIFHANLAISDNERSALLAIKIGDESAMKMIVAGGNPSKRLQLAVQKSKNCTLVSNPNTDEMNQLIQNAHVVLNISTINVGFKTRLISSLQLGRHQLTNYPSALNQEVDDCMIIEPDLSKWPQILDQLKLAELTSEDIAKRNQAIESVNRMPGWDQLFKLIKSLQI